MPRQISVPAQTALEEIQTLQEFPTESVIRVVVGLVGDDGEFLVPQTFSSYAIKDDMYTELLSANPSWNPSKPAGTYFNDDLWHFIDQLRNQNA